MNTIHVRNQEKLRKEEIMHVCYTIQEIYIQDVRRFVKSNLVLYYQAA